MDAYVNTIDCTSGKQNRQMENMRMYVYFL